MYVTGNRNAARKGGKRMAEILAEIYSWISFVPKITFKNLIEIAIIAILVYEMLIWIKNTRAWTLLKGIIFILAFFLAAAILELDTILWLLEKTVVHCGNGRSSLFSSRSCGKHWSRSEARTC